jgi:hypothetical protein
MQTLKHIVEFIAPAFPAIIAGVSYYIGTKVGWNMRGEAARVRRQSHKPFRG